MSESLQEFHDNLISEASTALRLISEAARANAKAIEAQANFLDHLFDGIRRFRAPVAVPLQTQEVERAVRQALDGFDTDLRLREDRERGIHRQPQTITPGEPGSTIHRTREGREVQALSPLDEPGHFADVSPDVLAREGIVIVEKVLEPIAQNTALDGAGRLVEEPAYVPNAQGFVPPPPADLIERMRLEDEAQRTVPVPEKPSDEAQREPEPETVAEEPVPEPEPAPQPDTPAQAVHKAQKAMEPAEEEPAPEIKLRPKRKPGETGMERVLNHYAEHGMGYAETSAALDIKESSVSAYISMGRTQTDPRAAQGDLKRIAREEAALASLRGALMDEAKGKNSYLVFPTDDEIGIQAYSVNYAEGIIEHVNGNVALSKQWLRVMDLLKDRDEHSSDDVLSASRFANERHILSSIRTINQVLEPVKLYILAEAKHYQLCSLR